MEEQSLAEYLLEARSYLKNPEFEEMNIKLQEAFPEEQEDQPKAGDSDGPSDATRETNPN